MTTTSFTYVTYIETTTEKLWDALTISEYTEKYFFGSAIQSDWTVGSEVKYLREGEVTDYGIITECVPNHILSYTWTYVMDKVKERNEPTKVTFILKPMGPTVKLTLKHENLLPSDIVEDDDTFHGFNNGWPAILSSLKSLLETGKPLTPTHI